MINQEFKCPKCGAPLEDVWDGEPVSAFERGV